MFKKFAFVAIAGCLCVAGAPARAAGFIEAKIDVAQIIQLPEKTATVVIGNPIVADVTPLKNSGGKMILTGRGFGETNLIALDAQGNSLGESQIRVKSGFGGDGNLVVQRGGDRESYSCAPRCQPTVVLGDNAKFVGETSGQIQAHTGASGGK